MAAVRDAQYISRGKRSLNDPELMLTDKDPFKNSFA